MQSSSPSRLFDPDEQICSGLGQSYESPSRNRKPSGMSVVDASQNGNSSFNSNGSIKLSSFGSGSNNSFKRKDGFMPTPKDKRRNGSGNGKASGSASVVAVGLIRQDSPNKSNHSYNLKSDLDSNQFENQENLSLEQQQQNSALIEARDHDSHSRQTFNSQSSNDSPTRNDPQSQLRRSTRNQSTTNSSTTPTTSPTKVKAKLTDGVSKPKSKVKKTPPIPNVVHSTSTSNSSSDFNSNSIGRGLGISLGLKSSSSREKVEVIRRLDVEEMDHEVGMEDSSFIFQDVSERIKREGFVAEEGDQESVKVHVRLRPPKPGEKCAWIPSIPSATLTLEPSLAQLRVQPGVGQPHKVDGILVGSDNDPVYKSVARPLIRAALEGYDAVIFAYGQTASGKTYTLGSTTEEGIIQKAIKDIFRGIKQSSQSREWLLRCSYLELFNEKVLDLLEPENKPQIRDDRKKGGKGIFVSPLREEIVTNEEQIRQLLLKGQENRHVGQTDWNERSSRSHTCFKLTIESWERDSSSSSAYDEDYDGAIDGRSSPSKEPPKSRIGKKIRVSELSLIDLAGSEKYVSQGSDRRTEGSHINKSLLTLAKVIFALSERNLNNGKDSNHVGSHVPYRDSKLTRILQNSLSGNSKISVICTINPNPNAIDESLSTLNFAKRIKKVNLNAKKNEIEGWNDGMDGMEAKALLIKYRKEMDGLKAQVKMLRRGGKGDETPTNGGNGSFGVGIDDDKIRELKQRLEIIESLMVRGEGNEDSEDEEPSNTASKVGINPSSSTTTSGSTSSFISDPSHVLQEKLYSANQKIGFLEKKLSSRPSISSALNDGLTESEVREREQLKLIHKLQNHVRELEMVCEAQTVDAPPKIREDVEREWKHKVEDLEKKLLEREGFVKEQSEEIKRLKRANQQLIRLAHHQTADLVNSLKPNPTSTSTLQAPTTVSQSAILSSQPRFNLDRRSNSNRPSSVIGMMNPSRIGLQAPNRNSFMPTPSSSSPHSSPRPSSRINHNGDFGTPTSTTSRPSRFRPRRSSQ